MWRLLASPGGTWRAGAVHPVWQQEDCQRGLWWENQSVGLASCSRPASASKHAVFAHIGGTFWTRVSATVWWVSDHQQLSRWHYSDLGFLKCASQCPEWDAFSLQNIHVHLQITVRTYPSRVSYFWTTGYMATKCLRSSSQLSYEAGIGSRRWVDAKQPNSSTDISHLRLRPPLWEGDLSFADFTEDRSPFPPSVNRSHASNVNWSYQRNIVCFPEVNRQSREDLASNLYCFALRSDTKKQHLVKFWVPNTYPECPGLSFTEVSFWLSTSFWILTCIRNMLDNGKISLDCFSNIFFGFYFLSVSFLLI